MTEEYIVVVDDNKSLCNAIAQQLKDKYEEDGYSVAQFYGADEATSFIRTKIDDRGDRLCLVASDERLEGMQGHEFLAELGKTHPKAKKFIFSAWSDVSALISGINTNIDGFVSKASLDNVGDPLFELVEKLLDEYRSEPKLEYTVAGITFRQADTLHEKQEFLRRRFENYLRSGHISEDMISPEKLDLRMEWDEYDIGGNKSIILTSKIRYLLAMKEGKCLGGVRVIDGKCPMEKGVCIGYEKINGGLEKKFGIGEKFSLDYLREQGIYTREISRFIIDKGYRRSSAVVLIGLLRLIEQLTSEQNTLFCTSKEEQLRLYREVGFEILGPRIEYTLKGEWIPMMRDRWKTLNRPETIPGMKVSFLQRVTEPIPISDVDKWNEYSRTVNEEAINRGLYFDE